MADDAITRGGIGGLGSPVYIYGPNSSPCVMAKWNEGHGFPLSAVMCSSSEKLQITNVQNTFSSLHRTSLNLHNSAGKKYFGGS